MTIQEGVHTFLSAQAPITALVSDRIYAVGGETDPDGDYLVYGIDAEPVSAFNGTPSTAMGTLTIVCASGEDVGNGLILASAARAALDNHSGGMGNVSVLSCRWIGNSDEDDPDRGLYFVSQQYQILYEL